MLLGVHEALWRDAGVMFGGPYGLSFSFYYCYVRVLLYELTVVILPLEAAVVVLSMVRRSGQPWRMPGFVLSVVALAAFGVGFVKEVVSIRFFSLFHQFNYVLEIADYIKAFREANLAASVSVSAGWLVLQLSTERDRGSGWVDRLGRFLGVVWFYLLVMPFF